MRILSEQEYTIHRIDGKWCIDGRPVSALQAWAMLQRMDRDLDRDVVVFKLKLEAEEHE